MKISAFTIVRNAEIYNYPVVESIKSILPLCDEFIVNVGDSKDKTLALVQSIKDPKIKIVEHQWDLAQKPDVLSFQSNVALAACTGDWAFYLQSDEVIHHEDLSKLKQLMEKYLNDPSVDGFQLKWLHFYGSYYRYRIDKGWFQKQTRIIRNNKNIFSAKDAWTFERKDGKPLNSIKTDCLLYHYGWVQPAEIMANRRKNAEHLWAQELTEVDRRAKYDYGNLDRFPVYFGTHPQSMQKLVNTHQMSLNDWNKIKSDQWWNPFMYVRPRYKTFRRVKEKIG